MSLMGLDIGTTGVKAAAFNLEGRMLTSAYRDYPLRHPQPGWSEIENRVWWGAVEDVLREANSRLKSDPVEALSVSAHSEACCLIAQDGRELTDLVVAFDQRSIPQAERLSADMGRMDIFRITGMSPHPMYTISKLMWFKEERSELFAQAWKSLCVDDYAAWKLTGKPAISHSMAARTMAFDVGRREWSNKMLSAAGLPADIFAPAVPSGRLIGEIRHDISESLGFSADRVLLASGGHDQACAALGAGIVEPGPAMNCTGTVDTLSVALANPSFSADMCEHNLVIYPHTADPHFVTLAFNHGGGLSLSWFRDRFSKAERDDCQRRGENFYSYLFDRLPDKPAKVHFLPHLAGAGTSYNDPHSKGAFVGLRVSTTWEEMARAIVDGLNFETRLNIDNLRRNNIPITAVRATGGGASSDKWMRLKASCFGVPVTRLAVNEAGCLGCAVLAGIASGRFADARAGVEAMVTPRETFEPDEHLRKDYDESYGRYLRLYPLLREFLHDLD